MHRIVLAHLSLTRGLARQGMVDGAEVTRPEPRQCVGRLERNQFLGLRAVDHAIDTTVGAESKLPVIGINVDLDPLRENTGGRQRKRTERAALNSAPLARYLSAV